MVRRSRRAGELVREAALHAGVAVVGRPVERGRDRDDAPAARRARRAGSPRRSTRRSWSSSGRSARQPSLTWLLAAAATSRSSFLGDRTGRAGVRARAARHARRFGEARVEPGSDVRLEAAPGRGQRERALDLVAGTHAAAARDAELVAEREVRVAVVVPLLVRRRRASAGRRRRGARPRRRARCARGRLGQLREDELDHVRGDPPRLRILGLDPHPVAAGRRARGDGPAASTATRQTRQAPNGASRSSQQSVGTQRPAGARGVEHGAPGSTSTATPSTVSFTEPSSSGKCARRLRIGAGMPLPWAQRLATSSVSSSSSSSARSTAASASTSSSPRCRPTRQGKHLPQLSCAPKASRCRASARMSVRSSKPTIDPWPSMQPSAASDSKSNGVSSRAAGQDPAERAADLQRLQRAPVAHAAAEPLADLAQRRAEPHLVRARPREALVQADELRGEARLNTSSPVPRDRRRVRERLDVVDHGRQPAPAALRRKAAAPTPCRESPRARRAAPSPRRRRTSPRPRRPRRRTRSRCRRCRRRGRPRRRRGDRRLARPASRAGTRSARRRTRAPPRPRSRRAPRPRARAPGSAPAAPCRCRSRDRPRRR